MPKRAYMRLAKKIEVMKAAAVLNPLNNPRKPARSFSSAYCRVDDFEKGSAMEKYSTENKMAASDIQRISSEWRTYSQPFFISAMKEGFRRFTRDLAA